MIWRFPDKECLQNDWHAPGQINGPFNPPHKIEKADPKGILKPWTNDPELVEKNSIEVIKRDSNFYFTPLDKARWIHLILVYMRKLIIALRR